MADNYFIGRCFPHVVNIAVQTILKELKADPYWLVIETVGESEPSNEPKAYATALLSDPIKKTQDLIAVCRASGQWCKELQNVIVKGNEDRMWELHVLQLL